MAGNNLVQSLLRGLDVLEAVGQSAHGLTLAEIARLTSCKTTTAHNLVRTLASRGYLEKCNKPLRFVLGPQAYQLTQGQTTQTFFQCAEASMGTIAKQYPGATVTLTQFRGGEVYVQRRIAPERPEVIERPVDHTMSPYTSASAVAFQAFWDHQSREYYRERYPFAEYGLHHWQSLEHFEKDLSQFRRQGYVELDRVANLGLILAVPIYGAGHQFIAVLGLRINPPDSAEEKRGIIDMLIHEADKLSQKVLARD